MNRVTRPGLAGLALLAACGGSPGDEPLAAAESALINGIVADESGPESFPAVVLMTSAGEGCTMTRVGPRHFLTAGHCFSTAELGIRVGSTSPAEIGKFTVDVRRSGFEGTGATKHAYDLAVITLLPNRRHHHQDLELLRPIETWTYEDRPGYAENLVQVGYGDDLGGGILAGAGVKRYGEVRTNHPHAGFDCSGFIDSNYFIELAHSQLVAHPSGPYFQSDDGPVSAPGDSGGPILRGTTVVGVHSGGDPDIHDGLPPVGTKRCGRASRIDVAFVDNLVKAPVIDGIDVQQGLDPAVQDLLGDIELDSREPGIVYMKGYNLQGATFTWSDGTPIDVTMPIEVWRDGDLGVDTAIFVLDTEHQPEVVRHIRAVRSDSSVSDDSRRGIVIHKRCRDHEARCGEDCVDLQTNPLHCGACDHACPLGHACAAGTCTKPPDPELPDDGGSPPGGTGEASTTGDPHVYTFDGLFYDQQAAGELLLVADDRGLVVQTRQEPWGDSLFASVNTAVAVGVAGHRVGIYARPEPRMLFDGASLPLVSGTSELPGLGSLFLDEGEARLDLVNGVSLAIVFQGDFLDLGLRVPLDGRVYTGLLGNGNGDPADDLTGRDGTRTEVGAPFAQMQAFALSWRIRADESLFDYAPGEDTASFDRPGFPRDPSPVLDPASPEYQAAYQVCVDKGVRGARVLEACAADVVLTGDTRFADSMAEALANLTPAEQQLYACVLEQPDQASCTTCCQAIYPAGQAEWERLASATPRECKCATRYPGVCEAECASDCAGDGPLGAACETCLASFGFGVACDQDPRYPMCMMSPGGECLMAGMCPQVCASR